MSSSNDDTEREIVKSLSDLGRNLLNSISLQVEDMNLLQLLNELALVLSTMDQAPTEPIQKSLLPSMKALISDELLRHTNGDVKISVTCCITEIARITAPEVPFNDELMKEIFKLIVSAFEKLSHVSGHCYEKVLSIIDNFANLRLCLVMLDLGCDDLVIEMFQHFLINIRSNHLRHVIDCMETIMTMVLSESEEISSDLLRPLLNSVRNENKTISPISWTLGEKVITNCAVKLKPYLMKAVESSGRTLDEYAQIVSTIFQSEFESPQHDHSNGSKEKEVQAVENNLEVPKDEDKQPHDVTKVHELDITCVIDAQTMDDTKSNMRSASASTKDSEVIKKCRSKRKKHSDPTKHLKSSNTKIKSENGNLVSELEPKSETRLNTVPRKRGRKEGYDGSCISEGTKTGKSALSRKARDSSSSFSPSENPASRKDKLRSKRKTASEAVVSELLNKNIIKPAQSRKTHNIGSIVPSVESPASNKVNAQSQPEDIRKGHGVSNSKPKADKNTYVASHLTNDNISHGSRSKGGRRRKINRTDNQDGDSKSVSKLKEGKLNPLLEETASESPASKPKTSIGIKFSAKKHVEKTAVAPELAVAKMETKDYCESKEDARSSVRRKRNQTTASETRDLGESLVGSKIKVWWPMDKMFYEGIVDSYDPVKGKHKILYADGEVEILNMKRQRWEVIAADVPADEEQGHALHKLAEASYIVQKIKEEPDLESDKSKNINFRSRGRSSSSISKC
ncbi:hypothetical protein Lalb_Chr04g0264431 [Lupinus albus]|uniref:Tudor domain-containing protein n=1 Tax=Lupinus albus TaxID=3870 RepID=A0A6A4QRM3_LUPAL|nr:hypothetical protein Lalb_Chr04g0264431 [Lupinus albus]